MERKSESAKSSYLPSDAICSNHCFRLISPEKQRCYCKLNHCTSGAWMVMFMCFKRTQEVFGVNPSCSSSPAVDMSFSLSRRGPVSINLGRHAAEASDGPSFDLLQENPRVRGSTPNRRYGNQQGSLPILTYSIAIDLGQTSTALWHQEPEIHQHNTTYQKSWEYAVIGHKGCRSSHQAHSTHHRSSSINCSPSSWQTLRRSTTPNISGRQRTRRTQANSGWQGP